MYSISLQTSKPVVTADDIIGVINFAASNEQDLRDSIIAGATISAIAEGPFTQVSNPTSLVFTTSDSGPSNEQVRITSVGNVGIGNPSPQYKLDVKGELNLLPYNTDHTIRLGRGSGKASIIAEGTEPKDQWLIMDSNGSSCALNYFSSNDVQLAYGGGNVSVGTTNPGIYKLRVAGGPVAFDGGHFTFNDAGANFDFRVEGDTDPNLIYVDASTDNVGIGLSTPTGKLHVETKEAKDSIVIGRSPNRSSIRASGGADSRDQYLALDSNGQNLLLNFFTDDDVQIAQGGGNVCVGSISNPISKLQVSAISDPSYYLLNLEDDTPVDADVGGGMILRGKYTSGGNKARLAGIKAGKTNSLEGDYKGYLKLETSTGSSLVERVRITDEGKVGVGITAPETKLDVQVSDMLDGIRVSGPLLPSVQIVSTGDNSTHAIIGNNQGQLTIAADTTQAGGAASALQLGLKGQTVVKITDAKAEVVDGTLAANILNVGPSATRHFSIYRDTGGTFGSAIIQDTLGDIKIIAGSAEAIKIMNDSVGGSGGIRIYDNYTLPIDDGSAGYVLKTDGSGAVTWQPDNAGTSVGGEVLGTGTAGYNARWSDSTTLANGTIQDNGSQVAIKGTLTGRALTVGGTTNSNSAILIQGTGVPAGEGSRGFLVSSYGNGDAYLWNFETRPLIFATSNAEAMRIGSDGSLLHSGGTAATIGGQSAYHIDVTAAEATIGGGRFQVKAGSTVVNEGGGSVDFRVEGDTSVYLLNVDGSEDRIGIGAASPMNKLDVYAPLTHDGIMVRGNNAPSIKIWDQDLAGGGCRIVDQNSVTTSGLMIIESDYNNVGIGSQIDFRVSGDSKMRVQQDSNIIMGAGAGNRTPMAGLENRNSSIIPHENTWEGYLVKNFPNGVADQKANIIFEGNSSTGGGTTGYIEIEITSSWANQNANGKVKKVISFIAANDGNGTIYNQESAYTEAMGLAPSMWAIGELSWDSTINKFYVPVVHRQAKGNTAAINVRATAFNAAHADRMFPIIIGDIYTTDTTVYEMPNVNVPQRLSVGGSHRAEYELDVSNNASVGDILIGNYAYTASSSYQGITHESWKDVSQNYMMISDGQDTLISSNRNTSIRCNGNDGSSQIQVTSILTQLRQDDNYIAMRAGSTKFNENANNVDFMVHGDGKLNMIYVDASADKVGIGTSTPTETLTANGGLENLGGWKWYSDSISTTGQGPASGFVLKLNDQYGTVLSKAYHYIVRLTTTGTGTRSGASFLVWWNTAPEEWVVRPIAQSSDVSNHPTLQVENDGTNDFIRVFTDNASPYPIAHTVESFYNGELDATPHSLGSDYQWQRYINDLNYNDGNVGIGVQTPALQSAGKGLHINSDGLHSEIKFTNTVTGSGANQGVALVASNSSFTINNRSAGEVNINTNNTNAISINSAQEVDIKKLLKVRLNNSVGTAGSINRISYYDDGTHSAGVGVSSGNVDYVAGGSVIQSFYTGGQRNLRLEPSGKVVIGTNNQVVAGDASLNHNVGICTNAVTNAAIQVLKVVPDTGLNTFFNQYNRLTVPSGDVTAVRGVYQDMVVQNGADLANIYGYTIGTNTVNTGGNVDTVIGYYINNVFLRGSASNYGIYSDVNEEEAGYANKWGLFLAGTAPNYYRGGMKTSLLEGRHGSDNICERVAGGFKALGNVLTNPGYLKIRLPEYLPQQKAGSTMLMFDVSVYEYKVGGYKNFHFGGYVYWNTSLEESTWINTTATMEVDRDIDNAEPWIYRFAVDEDDYPCVLIGRSGQAENTNWSYGQVYIQNVRTGFGRTAWDQWSQNWEISLETRDTATGGYYNMTSGFINKPFMQNQVDYKIVAGGTDVSSPAMNQIIIDQNQTVFNQNGVNTDFRVESDSNQHMIFVDASSDSVGIGLSNPRTDAVLHVGGPSSQNPTLMIGTGGNISSSICSLKFQDRGPAADQGADGQITGYVQIEREGNSQNFDMTFGTVNTTAGDAVERMRIDRDGLVGIGTNAPSKLLHVDNSGRGAGTSFLIQGDDDSYMSVQNSTSGDFLKLGNVYTTNSYMGLSHSDINNSGYMIMSDGNHTFVSANSTGRLYLRGGKNDAAKGEIRIGDQLIQVNPSMQNVDFIVYGDSVSQLFRTDASKDSVLIGNSTDGGVNSRLYVYDDGAAKLNVANSRTVQVQGRAYTTTNGTHYHIGILSRAEKWMSAGATDAGYVIGVNAVPVIYSDSAGGVNTLSEITALRANMSINSSLADGVNVTNAYDVKCIPSLAGTNSTVTNHYGIYLTSATNGATNVTNPYGVYQEDSNASNIFAGNMTIGSTAAPDSFDGLTVYGNISSKRTDAKIMAKDAAVVTKLQASVGAGGGIVGTESNHNLLIRSNNTDVARFDVNGNFQVKKGRISFSPQTEAGTDLYGGLYVQAPDITDPYIARFEGYPIVGPGFSIDSKKDLRINSIGGMSIKYSSNPVVNDPTLAERNAITFNADNIEFTNFSGFRNAPVETFKVNTDTGAVTINQNYTLPTTDGTNGQVLTTDGNGQVSWGTGGGSGGGSAAGSGAITGCKLGNWMGVPQLPVNVNFTSNTTSSSPAYAPLGPKVYWATPKFALTNNSTLFVFDDGVYTIDVTIQWRNNGAERATAAGAIEINGEIYSASLDYSYSRGNIYNQLETLNLRLTEVLSANDEIRVAIWKSSADAAADVVETEVTRTTVMKIADSISPS